VSCTQCGASVAADDPFCPKCGARQGPGLPVPADPQRAALERALGAQYEIGRLLGRGGMGAVYLAREKALERAVAIKVLPPDMASDADSRERFRREARTAAKLTHPNIVPLYTFGDAEGMLFFVMGFVRGESLGERMRREGKLPDEDVRRILAEVADALHYAHQQGVVHRDIKPDNILLDDETGRPMLTDFGVAKAKASGATLTEAGAVVGTPYYMSPEQASGAREIDGRSDLYSLGVMGYAMLSGRLPFEGDSFRDVIVQHVTQEPAPLVPEVPPDLAAAVMRCLAKEPAKRWGDGLQLRAALDVVDDDLAAPALELRFDAAGWWAASSVWSGAAFGLACYLFPALGAGAAGWWQLPVAIAAGGPLLVAATGAEALRRGVQWSALRRRLLYPPRWWPFWWPRRWRRPGDVWERLPGPLRRARSVAGGSLAWLLLVSAPIALIAARHGAGVGAAADLLLALVTGPVWLLIGAPMAPLWWARRRGIDEAEYSRLAFQPTSHPTFWRNPKFAALLQPSPGRTVAARPAEPRSPDDYAQAIRDLVGQLPSGTQATVSEAADAARQLLGTLAALDAELAKLAQDADPQELEAVEAKLLALGPEAQDEGDVRRQRRALLVPQRDLLRELNQRLREATDRRARLLDLLRTMWLQVATLRAEAAHDTLAVTEISGRIKALCTEIDAHVQAAETVRHMAP